MIKTRPVRCQQRTAGPESTLYRTQPRNYENSPNHLIQNLRAGEIYLLPTHPRIHLLNQNDQSMPTARRTFPTSRAAYVAPNHINPPPHIKREMFDHLKRQNTEHRASELFNGTTDCIQLPAIAPRLNKSFTIDLSSPVLQSITGGTHE